MRKTAMERIMSHVVKKDGHWIWSAKGRTGLFKEYGGTRLNGKMMSSHRAVWILHKGPIPPGVDLLHQCDVKLCCNPNHLRLGTHTENHIEAVDSRGGVHWNCNGGDDHHSRKLSNAQYMEITNAVANGESRRSVAAKYGITTTYVTIIYNRYRKR